MKRPVTSLCRRPGKKRPPAGQPVPGAGTISAHRDALWWASGAVGQKPPKRGRKNSHGGGRGLCTGCAHGGAADIVCGVVLGSDRPGCPPGQRARPGAKTAPGEGRGLCAGCAHGGMAGNGGVWCREGAALGARRGRGYARAQKQPPAGAGGCLDAGYGCYLPRAIRVIWMHRVGSTARPRIMPS